MPVRLHSRESDFERKFAGLVAAKREVEANVGVVVSDILRDVRRNGDAALVTYTEKFDRVTLTPETLRISAAEIETAVGECAPKTLEALNLAADRITDYHRRQMPEDLSYTDATGMKLGYRWTPVAAAGLYVPGGLAAYPSSVLMNALPAKVAGVGRLVMVVPSPDGVLNPLVLAAAQVAGVDEIYRIGGAQAVGGAGVMARRNHRTPSTRSSVPGNAFVAEAKRQVFGDRRNRFDRRTVGDPGCCRRRERSGVDCGRPA